MKQFIDDTEVLLVQEFIHSSSDDVIQNNQVLWNEVESLTQILGELQNDNTCSTSMVMMEEACHNEDLYNNKVLDFLSWQCIENLKHVGKLLSSKDCDEVIINPLYESYPNIHQLLLVYNQLSGCNNIEKDEQESNSNSYLDEKNDYFQMIDGIKSHLNLSQIILVVDSIREAFRLEATALVSEADAIRIRIDAKYKNISHGCVHFDKKVFAEINSFKKRLESEIATKQSLKFRDTRVNLQILPPLLQSQDNCDNTVRDNQKENDDPATESKFTSNVLGISKKNKKKSNIENALILANRLKLKQNSSADNNAHL
jgi:hypothetical protein